MTRKPSLGVAAKTAAKTADSLIEQPHGGALLRAGKKGNKGGGRLTDKFKATMLQLINDPNNIAPLKKILKGAHVETLAEKDGVPVLLQVDGDLYLKGLEYATKRVVAMPPQDITSGGEPLQATWMLINGIEVEF